MFDGPDDITELPKVVAVPDQPCQRLYEGNPVLLGFDMVHYHLIDSYRDGGQPVRGKSEFAYNFNGYQFWFSTEENRNIFIGDPWKYAPAWGGFCSWGVAKEKPPRWPWDDDYLGPPASPWTGWLIVDGKLIFNIYASYSDRFSRDLDKNMRDAEKRWTGWFGSLHAGPFNTHCIGHGTMKNWCLAKQPSPWLEDLPKCSLVSGTDACTDEVNSGGMVSINCTEVSVAGGGMVSNKDDYSDFDPDENRTPYQKKMIKLGASLGSIFVVAVIAFFFCRKRIKSRLGFSKRKDNSNDFSSHDTDSREDKNYA